MVNHNPSEENVQEFNKYADPTYTDGKRPPRRYKGSHILILVLIIGLAIFGFSTVKKQLSARDKVLSAFGLVTLSHPPKIDWLSSVFVSQNLKVGTGAQVDLIYLSSLYDSFGDKSGVINFNKNGISFDKMVNAKPSTVGSSNSLPTGPGTYPFRIEDKDLATGLKFGVKVTAYYYKGSTIVNGGSGIKASKPTWCFIINSNGVTSKWTSALNGMDYMQIGGKPLSCDSIK